MDGRHTASLVFRCQGCDRCHAEASGLHFLSNNSNLCACKSGLFLYSLLVEDERNAETDWWICLERLRIRDHSNMLEFETHANSTFQSLIELAGSCLFEYSIIMTDQKS